MGKVFVSHKNYDAEKAKEVAKRLESNGLSVYLDVIDEDAKDGPELGDYIREKLSECNQLMAVVSERTKESWWVPWEIGIATEKDFLISTFAAGYTSLPSYLKKWPYLQSMSDVDSYSKQAKETEQTIRKGIDTKGRVVQSFHRSLKASLGQ